MTAVPSGLSLPLWSVLPFAAFLLCIALGPLLAPVFWSRHYGKSSLVFGIPVAGWFLLNAPRELLHTFREYVSFIVLLAGLFTVSGGILLSGARRSSPGVNCGFLAAGAVLSNLLGTTGASMLLVRPLLRANAGRRSAPVVVVFFIFVAGNIGGLLTPLGDPPLYLGYLRGVPFFWTLSRLWPVWLLALGLVLAIFCLLDLRAHRAEGATAGKDERVPFRIEGAWNLPLLGGILASLFIPTPWRELAMVGAAAVSLRLTPKRIREANGFSWRPMEEVAILFAGIFATMTPALLILSARGGALGVTAPWHLFWATGIFSSFLDNAPTYLSFVRLAQGLGGPDPVAGVSAPLLSAISAGAVFMGANSYIGNAPNFMIKAIAEGAGVRMPSFLGYMAWSGAVLLPVFGVVTLVFFA